jgi:hypothetical protein
MTTISDLLLFVLVLGGSGGCSVSSESLSRDSFHGTIRYVAVRDDPGPTDCPSATNGEQHHGG